MYNDNNSTTNEENTVKNNWTTVTVPGKSWPFVTPIDYERRVTSAVELASLVFMTLNPIMFPYEWPKRSFHAFNHVVLL